MEKLITELKHLSQYFLGPFETLNKDIPGLLVVLVVVVVEVVFVVVVVVVVVPVVGVVDITVDAENVGRMVV
jgi:hypothetical protein